MSDGCLISPPRLVSHRTSPAVAVRSARTADVPEIRRLLDLYTTQGILLDKATVALYEDVPEFMVAELPEESGQPIVGCGALHVMWEDLAEVRTIAADPTWRGCGIGHAILLRLLERARELGVRRVFCLTFEVEFFSRHGFEAFDEIDLDPAVRAELLRSYDEGVAEFLGLEHVKPNILGNVRMRLEL